MLLFIMVKLYHATPTPFQGTTLEPRTSHRIINGKQGPFAFAASDEGHALTYTVPKGVRLMNAHIAQTGAQILVIDRESDIEDPDLTGGIYEFESNDFEQAIFDGKPSNQWITTQPVNLEMATYTPISSLNKLMKAKIQLYQIGENNALTKEAFMEAVFDENVDTYQFIQDQLENENMRWMNQEQEINPTNPFPTTETGINHGTTATFKPSP